MADGTRSHDASLVRDAIMREEEVVGDKAVGGVDADKDHLPNVEGGLKAAISNPNTSTRAKNKAEAKLETIEATKQAPHPKQDSSVISGRS